MKYLITSAIDGTDDNALRTFLALSVTTEGVASLNLEQLIVLAKKHHIFETDGDDFVSMLIDVPIGIQSVFSCTLEVLDKSEIAFKNIISSDVQKLSRGKQYIISDIYAPALQSIPDCPLIKCSMNTAPTINEGDQLLMGKTTTSFFLFTAYEDTNFQNIAGSVPVIQMDLKLDALAKDSVKAAKNQRDRRNSLLNFPQ